jgi:sulfur carrier protein
MTSATQTASTALTIRVNDEPRALSRGTTLLDLARDLGVAERKGVAIAINDSVVARAAWPTHSLADGDRVLVIRATQGG